MWCVDRSCLPSQPNTAKLKTSTSNSSQVLPQSPLYPTLPPSVTLLSALPICASGYYKFAISPLPFAQPSLMSFLCLLAALANENMFATSVQCFAHPLFACLKQTRTHTQFDTFTHTRTQFDTCTHTRTHTGRYSASQCNSKAFCHFKCRRRRRRAALWLLFEWIFWLFLSSFSRTPLFSRCCRCCRC